jgi:hypothetical protein
MLEKILAKRQAHGLMKTLVFLGTRLLRTQKHLVYSASCAGAREPEWLPGELAIRSSRAHLLDPTLSSQLLSISAGNRQYVDAISRGEAEALVVVHDGRVVHYGFLMHRNKTTCLLGFAKRVGLLGNAFTVPSYRGRGCQIRSVAARIKMAEQAGLERVISETGYDNAASQRNIMKGGMTLLGRFELVVALNALVIRYKRPSTSIPMFGLCA